MTSRFAHSGRKGRATKCARTLLVHMPWYSPGQPPLGVAVLKSYLRAQGRPCDVIYPSLLWARQIGLAAHERLLKADFCANWFFGYSLFGSRGTREMPDNWQGLLRGMKEYGSDLPGGWLRQIGHSGVRRLATSEVPRFLDSCMSRYPWHKYDIIGFSTTSLQDLASLALSRLLKRRYPDKLVVLGGINNVAGEMGLERLRAFPWIDVVVGGEGERALLEVARAVEQGGPRGPVAGTYWRQGGRILAGPPTEMVDLNTLPFPDHSDYLSALREHGLAPLVNLVISVEESRGCWWGEKKRCVFCSLPDAKYRVKNGRRLMGEVRWLASRHKLGFFSVCHQSMGKEMLSNFLPRLRRAGLDLRMKALVRADHSRTEIKLMAAAGVKELFCGIEALSTSSLKSLGKGTRAIQNIQLLKHAKECGIRSTWIFLYDIPGQSPQADAENLANACLISHLDCGISDQVGVRRFSPYHERGLEMGVRNARPKWVYPFLFPKDKVDLNRVAYWFDYDAPKGTRQAEYRAALHRLLSSWQRAVEQGQTFLFQERLPGLLKVYDCRLHDPGNPRLAFRVHELKGLEAELYLRCGSMRAERELLDFAAKSGAQVATARRCLHRLERARLLFRDGRHYLGLALPADTYPTQVREKAYAWGRRPFFAQA